MTWRRTCGSTAGSCRASGPASGRPSTSTRSWRASRSAGAIYLALIAILPEFLITGFKVAPIPFIGERLDATLPRFITQGMGVQFYFGGTSLLIIVGVAMDTVQQVESQLIMRHYEASRLALQHAIERFGLPHRPRKAVEDVPFAASGRASRSLTMPIISSSPSSSPRSISAFARSPSSVPLCAASRRMSPVEILGMPRACASRTACVPLPDAGGPSITTFRAIYARRPRIRVFFMKPS